MLVFRVVSCGLVRENLLKKNESQELGGVLLTKRAFLSWKLNFHTKKQYVYRHIHIFYIYILPVALVKKTKKKKKKKMMMMMMMITTVTILMIIVFPFPLHFPSFF